MGDVRLDELRDRVRNAADQEGSTFVSDARLNALINAGLDELYEIVLKAYGENYFDKVHTFPTVVGTETYALPADFAKLIGEPQLKISGTWVPLEKYPIGKRNEGRTTSSNGTLPRYRLRAGNLVLRPAPSAIYDAEFDYQPTRVQLAANADVCSFPNGWEWYAVHFAAIDCLGKEESDTSGQERKLARLKERIEGSVENRDAATPEKVVDTDAPTGRAIPYGGY